MSLAAAALSGFALQGSLIVAIGAQNAFVLRQGLRREHVGLVVAFCAGADLLLSAAGVAGVGAGLAGAPALLRALTLGGAGFLGWHGLGTLRRAMHPAAPTGGEAAGASSCAAALGAVAGFTLLNPGVYVDAVLLVGTTGAAEPASDQPAFVAGAGLASLAWFAGLGYGARLLAPVFARPAAWRWLDGGVALVMFALAASLAGRAVS